MENFSLRTTAVIVVGFLLLAVGWGFAWEKVQELSYPPVHCDYHFQHMTCAPAGKAA